MLLAFSCAVEIEDTHPLQCGMFRLKRRIDRRPGMPIESAWRFYPRVVAESAGKLIKYYKIWRAIDRLRVSIRKDPNRASYHDIALTPVETEETETLALFTHNEGARSAVQHARKIKELTKAAAG
jgi:hypothetical protein